MKSGATMWEPPSPTAPPRANPRAMTSIGIVGADGRMGRAIAEEAREVGLATQGIDRDGDICALASASDVLIDFSHPDALQATLDAAVAAATPLLVGTTGLEAAHHAAIDRAAGAVAVLQTGNTSLGVTLLAHLVREAAARLGPDWDIEIAEMHHRHKLDAPSGTALLLGEAAAAGRGATLAQLRAVHDGVRREGSIGFASLRGGSVAGDHDVIFAGEGERLTLAHRAESRAIFARGAIRAAQWLVGRAPGRYSMNDVLGLASLTSERP